MYHGFRQSFEGLTRSIGDFLNRRIASLVSASAAIVLLFLIPYFFLVPSLVAGYSGAASIAASVILFQLTWCIVLYDRGLRWYVPFLYPATFALGIVMFWRGYHRLTRGTGLTWKGRVVR